MKESARPGGDQAVKVVKNGAGGAARGWDPATRNHRAHGAGPPAAPSRRGRRTGRNAIGAAGVPGPGPTTPCRGTRPGAAAASHRWTDERIRHGSSRSFVDRAIALDDGIRCVGCRAATGVVVGHVEWEAPPGVEPGRVRLTDPVAGCRCGSSRAIPRVGALEGHQTSWEVDPNARDVRSSRAGGSGVDGRSLRESARSREDATRPHQADEAVDGNTPWSIEKRAQAEPRSPTSGYRSRIRL